MSDSYNSFETKYETTRKALQVIQKYGFGLALATKSDLITRDIDIFKEINKRAPVILKITITTADDNLSKIIEPAASLSSKRFEAIKKLSEVGLFAGVLFSPILPFITDTEENIRDIVKKAHENGARFIFSMGGVTLAENQRDYFYNSLDKYFPGVKEKYIKNYGNKYLCQSMNKNIGRIFKEECEKYGILYRMKDIIAEYKKGNSTNVNEQTKQLNLFEM